MSRPPAGAAATAAPADQLQAALQHVMADRTGEAEPLLEAVLARDPRNPDALHLMGLVRHRAGEHERALALVADAVGLADRSPLFWNSLGSIQRALGRTAEAADSFGRAIELAPTFAQAHINRGLALHALGRMSEAEPAYRRAAAIAPDHGRVHAHLGAALFDLGRHDEAAAAFGRALALGPAEPALRILLARALMRGERYAEAIEALEKALAVNPGDTAAEELLHECRALLCDWSADEQVAPFYRRKIAAGRLDLAGETVFPAIPGLTRADHLALARGTAARIAAWIGKAPARAFARLPRPRLRIGYLSGNFRDRPIARLAVELFELHDRARVEVFGYSTRGGDGSALRTRLAAAFDRFADLHAMSFGAAAGRIAADGIDVLVDLDGYAPGAVPQLLALRPAPIQASFLGYPGTMGAPFVDYIVADRFVLPPEHAADYAEAPAYLPDCYLPLDRTRRAEAPPPRAALGLPPQAVVFACFAAGAKITPALFDVWMSLLARTPGSVLWLRDWNAAATRNLRAAAERRGQAGRLVFAAEAEPAAHLARLGAADLCLATFPHNMHAGAADALAAGVPIVTCVGDSFASRVCASALSAAGLPELITGSLDEYRALAERLAADRAILRELRERLAAARASAPLFDTPRFARSLEALYQRMWDRHVAGEAPGAIHTN
jgi:predicted O-linked N-acetylglucosamine transferase (SPINDLY family)